MSPAAPRVWSKQPRCWIAPRRPCRSNRYLQQRSSIVRDDDEIPANRGFIVGRAARVRIHIGPPDRESNALPDPFPENVLPQELDSWDLQVWLAEPMHLPVPLGAGIILRRTGNSTACTFEFTPEVARSVQWTHQRAASGSGDPDCRIARDRKCQRIGFRQWRCTGPGKRPAGQAQPCRTRPTFVRSGLRAQSCSGRSAGRPCDGRPARLAFQPARG